MCSTKNKKGNLVNQTPGDNLREAKVVKVKNIADNSC